MRRTLSDRIARLEDFVRRYRDTGLAVCYMTLEGQGDRRNVTAAEWERMNVLLTKVNDYAAQLVAEYGDQVLQARVLRNDALEVLTVGELEEMDHLWGTYAGLLETAV